MSSDLDIVRLYPFHIVAWYCIMECHAGLRDRQKAAEVRRKLDELVRRDARSAEMFRKYGRLMPSIARSEREVSAA